MYSTDDTAESINSFEEPEDMLSRYHFHNIIYLYGVFEDNIANEICGSNNAKMPLVLYETPMTAYKLQKDNLQNPRILRFAVDINLNGSVDELVEESAIQIKNSKLTKDEIYTRAKYIRSYNSKEKCIQYKLNDKSIIINVQNI